MTLWTREEMAAAASRHDRESEFERRRRERMDERASRARLYRVQSGNAVAFPSRPPLTDPPDRAA